MITTSNGYELEVESDKLVTELAVSKEGSSRWVYMFFTEDDLIDMLALVRNKEA